MRIRYDAKEIAESIENMSCEFGRYRTNADILEEQYEKYCRNDTYIGLAAKASKKFIGEGQMKLHYENLEIQKMVLDRYMAIEDDFKSMVDSSPEARIDTDALKENSDHYEKQLEYLDRIGRRVEDRSDYVIEKFGKYNSDITRASYSGTRMSYDEECEYIAKCIKTVKEFDELSLCAVQNSGMAECISDLQDDITRTTMALGQMKAYEPKMDKVELNLLPQGGAPKAMTTLGMSGSTNNVQLTQINALFSLNGGMTTTPYAVACGASIAPMTLQPEIMVGLEEAVVDVLKAGAYAANQIKAVVAQLPALVAAASADGPLPIGDLIAIGILAVDAIIIIIKTAEYLWDNNCLNESKADTNDKSKIDSQSKGKQKEEQKDENKDNNDQAPPSKSSETDSSSKPNSQKLRKNMKDAGMPEPNFPNAAHHIVAGGAAAASRAREILEQYNIDINDANNGVFLPTVRDASEAAYHCGLHTAEYYKKVEMLLEEATSREDCIEILRDIADQLMNGTF